MIKLGPKLQTTAFDTLVIAMFKIIHIMAIATHGAEWLDLHFSHAFRIWATQSLKCSIYPDLRCRILYGGKLCWVQ